jgi:hypothetical protein
LQSAQYGPCTAQKNMSVQLLQDHRVSEAFQGQCASPSCSSHPVPCGVDAATRVNQAPGPTATAACGRSILFHLLLAHGRNRLLPYHPWHTGDLRLTSPPCWCSPAKCLHAARCRGASEEQRNEYLHIAIPQDNFHADHCLCVGGATQQVVLRLG